MSRGWDFRYRLKILQLCNDPDVPRFQQVASAPGSLWIWGSPSCGVRVRFVQRRRGSRPVRPLNPAGRLVPSASRTGNSLPVNRSGPRTDGLVPAEECSLGAPESVKGAAGRQAEGERDQDGLGQKRGRTHFAEHGLHLGTAWEMGKRLSSQGGCQTGFLDTHGSELSVIGQEPGAPASNLCWRSIRG